MTETSTVVRRLDGPFVTRLCVRTRRGYHWMEQSRDHAPYLTAAQLEPLRRLVPSTEVRAAFPVTPRPATARWPALPTPMLLCDLVFAQSDDEYLTTACSGLGSFLGLLHSIPVDHLQHEFPLRSRPAWHSEGSPSALAVDAARARMRGLGTGVLERASAALEAHPGPPVIVHGRFSTGICAAASPPVVLGWREAGIGDPLRDVAFFVSELVEATAISGTQRRLDLVSVFLRTYLKQRPQAAAEIYRRLAPLVADRLLEHYAQSTLFVGGEQALQALRNVMARVTQEWKRFCDLLEGHRP